MDYAEIALSDGVLFDTEQEPKCEYRHAQYDNGTGQGLLIPCRNKAAMWTDRGLRCTEHGRD